MRHFKMMLHAGRRFGYRDERGVSVSVFVMAVIAALIIACGLAVDGAAASSARRRAEAAAAQLARVGQDAATGQRLLAQDANTDAAAAAGIAAINAARGNYPNISVALTYEGGQLRVSTTQIVPTTLLQLIGISTITVHGSAIAEVARLP
ncbi:MAG: hypothetical protein LBM94_00310 [Propionibacteriaceae bacterium]|jgi:hypothetical protein|nr:hypothetical protein [Propionibacteriaceae bacterium]